MKSFHHPLPSSSGFLGRASLIAHARPKIEILDWQRSRGGAGYKTTRSFTHISICPLSLSSSDCDSTRRSLSQKFTLRVMGFGSFHYTGLMLCSSCYPGKLPQECHHSSLLLASLPRSEELTPTTPKPWWDFAIQILSVSAASFHACDIGSFEMHTQSHTPSTGLSAPTHAIGGD